MNTSITPKSTSNAEQSSNVEQLTAVQFCRLKKNVLLDCSICLSKMSAGDKNLVTTSCGCTESSIFHLDCLSNWAKRKHYVDEETRNTYIRCLTNSHWVKEGVLAPFLPVYLLPGGGNLTRPPEQVDDSSSTSSSDSASSSSSFKKEKSYEQTFFANNQRESSDSPDTVENPKHKEIREMVSNFGANNNSSLKKKLLKNLKNSDCEFNEEKEFIKKNTNTNRVLENFERQANEVVVWIEEVEIFFTPESEFYYTPPKFQSGRKC